MSFSQKRLQKSLMEWQIYGTWKITIIITFSIRWVKSEKCSKPLIYICKVQGNLVRDFVTSVQPLFYFLVFVLANLDLIATGRIIIFRENIDSHQYSTKTTYLRVNL